MKIKSVVVNNKAKALEIETVKGLFRLPFAKLRLKPSSRSKISEIFVDKEMASQGITYRLESGEEDSIHLDAFLDYNRDPDYMRAILLHKLTVEAEKKMKLSGLSKHEVIRRLKTSPSQLYRLLDPTNNKKSVDEMLRLISVLGYSVELNLVENVAY